MIRFSIVALAVSFLIAIVPLSLQEQEKSETPQEDDKIVVPADDENAIARKDFMRAKLMYSQNIFEGLTTGDFLLIQAGIKEVQGITEGEQWVAIDNDHYRKLTEDFKTSVKRLKKAAESRNLDAIALRYYNMSTSCIDCHDHLRHAEYSF